jgi:hypothetical protein
MLVLKALINPIQLFYFKTPNTNIVMHFVDLAKMKQHLALIVMFKFQVDKHQNGI